MATLFKRGKYWNFDFQYRKQRHQGTTHCTNKEDAKLWLSKFRTNLAFSRVGLIESEPAPILAVFLKGSFLDNVRQNAKKPRTRMFYEERVKRLCEYLPFTQLRLDRIDELAIQGYKDFRLVNKLSPSTINGELRTLRKALLFADRCGLARYQRIRTLPGERTRDFVLDGEMETRYLAACDYPLRQVAILMLDLGLRPEEAVSLRKSSISDVPPTVTVLAGKTANARRILPQTERTREVFDLCFALYPDSEWVFPGSKGAHFTRGAIDNMHTKLRDKTHTQAGCAAADSDAMKAHPVARNVVRPRVPTDTQFPREFVLYSLRHTFGTRLAQSGAQVWEIKKAMGHGSVKVSERYIHLTSEDISLAMKRKELFDRLMRGEVKHEPPPIPESVHQSK